MRLRDVVGVQAETRLLSLDFLCGLQGVKDSELSLNRVLLVFKLFKFVLELFDFLLRVKSRLTVTVYFATRRMADEEGVLLVLLVGGHSQFRPTFIDMWYLYPEPHILISNILSKIMWVLLKKRLILKWIYAPILWRTIRK